MAWIARLAPILRFVPGKRKLAPVVKGDHAAEALQVCRREFVGDRPISFAVGCLDFLRRRDPAREVIVPGKSYLGGGNASPPADL